MRLPLSCCLQNLVARRFSSLMTATGIALTVAVLLACLALIEGLDSTFKSTGNPLNVLVLRKGSTSELNSAMTRPIFQELLFEPGIANEPGEDGPMASLEIVTVVRLRALDDPSGMSVTVRGLLPVGLRLRDVVLREGRWFRSGQREVVAGQAVSRRCPDAQVGGRLRFGKQEWTVVGVLDGGSSALGSEIFADLNQVSSDFNRQGQLSSALLRVRNEADIPQLIASLNEDRRMQAFAQREQDYYGRQTESGGPLRALGIFVSALMAIGSSFSATNTMYAAVGRRTREIATLRVLGFSRGSILTAFIVESVLLAVAGGVLACFLVLPLNGISTAVGNMTTLSDVVVNFRVGPVLMLTGLGYAAVLGAIGGFLPARQAANKEIVTALGGN